MSQPNSALLTYWSVASSASAATSRERAIVDAMTGAQIWAQRYDRGLADIFSVESELAEAIVGQLRSKLSPEEKAAIGSQPTSDLEAFELYTKARNLLATSTVTQGEEKRLQAVQLLEQAIARDSAFLRAYCTH